MESTLRKCFPESEGFLRAKTYGSSNEGERQSHLFLRMVKLGEKEFLAIFEYTDSEYLTESSLKATFREGFFALNRFITQIAPENEAMYGIINVCGYVRFWWLPNFSSVCRPRLVEYRDSFLELNVRSNKEMREIVHLLLEIKKSVLASSSSSSASRGPSAQLNDGGTTSATHGGAHTSATSSRGPKAPARRPGK